MTSLIFGLNLGGNELPWTHPLILTILPLSAAFFGLFLLVEGKFAKEPILPLYLLSHRTPLAAALVKSANISRLIIVKLVFHDGGLFSYLQPSSILSSSSQPVSRKIWPTTYSKLHWIICRLSRLRNTYGENCISYTQILVHYDRDVITGLGCQLMHFNL